ncbi:bifunctional tetrahydrofolate synthase/dihydrofolate synthase [Maricurvus nonylphenolicus]
MGLGRVSEVASRMGLLDLASDPSRNIITIAGTNGKGSCVATLEAMACAQGISVGAFTSPHFLHYCERIRVNGNPVDDALVCEAFEAIEQARGEISLTYFEFGTLAALEVFRRQGVSVLLLEVGLGGRLDAVNIIDSQIAVVTSIDIDHEEWLGNDREVIGAEKAGVFRAGCPAICADPNAPASIARVAAETNADLWQKGERWDWQREGNTWSWQGQTTTGEAVSVSDLVVPSLPLPSVAAALQVATLLGWPLESVVPEIAKLSLTGRAQIIQSGDIPVWLDVAHNPAAAKLLAEHLASNPVQGKTLAVMAVMADKDIDGLLSPLISQLDCWYCCSLPGNARAALANSLAQDTQRMLTATGLQQSVTICDTVASGLTQALEQAQEGDRVLVLGSFFTVAEAITALSA